MAARSRLVFWLTPAALWLWLFFHLHDEWSLNPQYFYGWAVPFLAAFFFYLRWLDRPAPNPPKNDSPAKFALALLLFFLLPLRLIEEANPDWRVVSWSLGLVAGGYSLVTLARAVGFCFFFNFAFPIFFVLVAVPWPVQLENLVVQGLTRAVAFAAVEIASWLGIGALQIGNIIELPTGFVGVSEACSGVKTLQAAIMVALALGELFSLGAARRFVLLLVGCAWVFFCNVLRASILVVIAAKKGTDALDHWHDLIGTLVLVVGMGGLLAFAWILRRKGSETRRSDPGPGAMPSTFLPLVSFGWLLFVFAATEFWYRSHEKYLVQLPAWETRWPNESKKQPIP
ncbi:MAG: exosortase/archaeosortase family protein, partial [Verrucomicrobiota bacterium]|nr:exosortase/archaeosortase family protein [Verrucomicrobiota bacterium]